MGRNYNKLKGRMAELGLTQTSLAASIKINESTMSQKLCGKSAFTTTQIDEICKVLDIANEDIGAYFFTV
jgi:DNA-binding Xre family transcriptional regulator